MSFQPVIPFLKSLPSPKKDKMAELSTVAQPYVSVSVAYASSLPLTYSRYRTDQVVIVAQRNTEV